MNTKTSCFELENFSSNAYVSPLDTVPNSIVSSHAPSVISSMDEGGFNEPSPEIKAKLKPAYTFETSADTDKSNDAKSIDADFNEVDYNAHQHSLHYVDFGYRLNPDGSESKQCFSEEQYDTADNLNGLTSVQPTPSRCDKRTVHYPVTDSVVYAAIKSEPASYSPSIEPATTTYNGDVDKNYRLDDYQNDDSVSDIDEKFEQIYSSATKDLGEYCVFVLSIIAWCATKCDTFDLYWIDVDGEVRLPDGDSSLTLDNVEFADASDKEDSLPDAMTSYEADRLLSSRWVHSFKSDQFSYTLFVLLTFVCVYEYSIEACVERSLVIYCYKEFK